MIYFMVANKVCRIDGCTNILKKQDGQICQVHRSRWFRHKNYDISPDWKNLRKGKPSITSLGYVRININGKRILYHRYIMEQYLGRQLTKDERIHHINGIKTDNRIENLELIKNQSEHMKNHHTDKWKTRKISPEYTAEEIAEIIARVAAPPRSYNICFCGKKFFSKNLCNKHYAWAYVHKFY